MLTQSFIIAFVLGASLLQRQAELPEMIWVWSLLPIVSTAWVLWHYQSQSTLFVTAGKISLWLFFLGVGFLWAVFFAQLRLADSLPQVWEGEDIQLIGVVANLPQSNDRNVRFRFDVEQVLTNGAVVPQHISLAWYRNRATYNTADTLPQLNAGERWQMTVRLKRPHGTSNPHGFDYESWALERNIRATGYVRQSSDNIRIDSMVNRPIYWVQRIRQGIQQRFAEILPEHAYLGVLITLATGDQRAIHPDHWQVFTRTGTNHLMAISGLHITMVSSIVFALVYWAWRWNPYLLLRFPARRVAAIAGLIVAFVYTLLSGFAIPAQRAFYMLAVVAIALWQGRFTSATTVLSWALLMVVIIDPWAVQSPGFWLSFGAITIILLITVGRIGQVHWLVAWLRVQGAITLGLIPLLLVMFQQVSLVSPIANAIAIPLVSLVVVPLTLLATIPLLDFVLPLAHVALSYGMQLLQWLSELPQAVWQQHTPPGWTMLVAIIGIIWVLLPTGFPARWLGFAALLPMFLVLPPKPKTGELWLTVLDVGQGLAVVAQTKQHTLLFDTGPNFGQADSGSRIIMPFLRGEGIRQLDVLMVSHADSDHSGGALSILNSLPVAKSLSGLNPDHPIQQIAKQQDQCHSEQSWQWDEVHFELLHPLLQSYVDPRRNTNASSCVLKITSPHGSVLLPADIGRQAERALLNRAADKLPATVLIAPHHGSNTSSIMPFIRQVNPELNIFTVGYRNRFNHPRDEVVERYQALEIKSLRSDHDGAILLRFTANGLTVETWRDLRRRYWQQTIF